VAQRPDVRAAEAQLHAASAQVGVAQANRLPSFNLSAAAGSSALQFSKLFSAGTSAWSLGLEVAQPIFDAGALRHRQRAAEATYEQAAAQYRSTVVVAFQNVADTLNAIDADAGTLGAAFAAERAAKRSLDIARRQHSAGSVGALSVLTAEQAWRQATLGRIQAQAGRLGDTALLFQALGGGWWNRPAPAQRETS
jgi:NodT family efflux transporter outer membrane factor (OMF) lipoprotein